jgi:hypothetical protein
VFAAKGTVTACVKATLAGFGANAPSEAHMYSAKAPSLSPYTASPG